MRRNQRDTFARSAMKLLCTLLGLILAGMLAVTFGFQALLQGIHTAAPTPGSGGILSAFSQAPAKLLSLNDAQSRTVNLLLIGQDRREDETQARSDTMILCTWNRESNTLTMTSFLRDLYVPIPGHSSNRINAAYSFGGANLLKETIEENFDVAIDGCIEVDFSQFSGIIDLLGGVELELRQDEADFINQETGSSLTEGTQTLTGIQALTYSRIRSLDLDGDFSRTNRQRKVISALVESYRQIRFTRLVPLLEELMPMLTTDLSSGQLLMLGLELVPNLSDAQVTSQRIPADGTFEDATIDGMSVLKADLEAAKALLRETLSEN